MVQFALLFQLEVLQKFLSGPEALVTSCDRRTKVTLHEKRDFYLIWYAGNDAIYYIFTSFRLIDYL